MLTKRIIPCLDMTEGKVVKGVKFVDFRDAGDPVCLAAQYDREGADELVFLDIAATVENREILLDVVRRTAERVTIPFSVGGGVRTSEDMKMILRAGADKVSVNTGGFLNPKLISDCANTFGVQCVVLSLDVRRKGAYSWNVFIEGGRTDTGVSAIDWVKEAVDKGVGEILLTSIDSDGTKSGFDVDLTKTISKQVTVPVIASGGAGTLSDFKKVLTIGAAAAALAASVFHFGKYQIAEVKNYLKRKGIKVRN